MTQDLTVGKPLLRVWQFAVPVLFGLLLQQVYSLVDTAIVGHALGVMALGGVGATGSVNFLVLGFLRRPVYRHGDPAGAVIRCG